jgi:anti-anti-sigma factor
MAIEVSGGLPDDLAVEPPLLCHVGQDVSFHRYSSGRWTVIEAVGEIDVAVTPVMQQVLNGASSAQFIFDLSRVSFMDASGLSVLVAARGEGTPISGNVRLVGPTDGVRKLLKITQLDTVLPIYACLEEATRSE